MDTAPPPEESPEGSAAKTAADLWPAIVASAVLGLVLIGTLLLIRVSTGKPQAVSAASPAAQTSPTVSVLVEAQAAARAAALRPTCDAPPMLARVTGVESATRILVSTASCDMEVAYAGVRAFAEGNGFGAAVTRNIALVGGMDVRLESDVSDASYAGVRVRHVFVADELVSEVLVQLGLLRVDIESPDQRYRERLTLAEQTARRLKRGHWSTEGSGEAKALGPVRIVAINPFAEVVTIVSLAASPVDLTGWTLVAVANGSVYEFPRGTTLSPGQSLQIVSGVPGAPPDRLFWTPDQIWRDDQTDSAELRDAAGRVIAAYPP